MSAGSVASVASYGAYAVSIWAMTFAPIAVVAALRGANTSWGPVVAGSTARTDDFHNRLNATGNGAHFVIGHEEVMGPAGRFYRDILLMQYHAP